MGALREIRAGKKASCWMWYMVPTPLFIVDGEVKGSRTNQRYALKNDAEAQAFLAFEADGVNLRNNYLAIMQAVVEHLKAGKSARALFGHLDDPKLRSSARLFERISRDGKDEELHVVMLEVLELLGEQPEASKTAGA